MPGVHRIEIRRILACRQRQDALPPLLKAGGSPSPPGAAGLSFYTYTYTYTYTYPYSNAKMGVPSPSNNQLVDQAQKHTRVSWGPTDSSVAWTGTASCEL